MTRQELKEWWLDWREEHSLSPWNYIPLRLRLAVHVLRGRPLMYGIKVEGRFFIEMPPNAQCKNCTFIGKDFPEDAHIAISQTDRTFVDCSVIDNRSAVPKPKEDK